ncbi:uncharacterized protein LOC129707926 isoform X2 [Leucoraja erinacea]|uniref:uncharacterized protein LOC129707926 isoform X2 n=1 Tax=Leucoraja erinaceus TaxID=7782 RepID=UPI002458FFFC|nr:uncharacterized protein LOC129707926 isoform X2 [Leucoraja erinacea]
MLGPNVYFRDLWNQCIIFKTPATGAISRHNNANEAGAKCAKFVMKKCDGHPGSAELWSLLRENSEAKLALMDAQMSNVFKSVFSIYTRDLRMKQDRHLHLNCLSDDWEQDFEKLHHARFHKCASHVRNSLGLMNSAATINKNRASVIIANNPLPDINDMHGKDSPMRFLGKNPSKLKYPLRKHLTLPPLKESKHPSSNIMKHEEYATTQEKALTTTKKESTSHMTKRKDWRKITKTTNLHSQKSTAKTKSCNMDDNLVISIIEGLDACYEKAK